MFFKLFWECNEHVQTENRVNSDFMGGLFFQYIKSIPFGRMCLWWPIGFIQKVDYRFCHSKSVLLYFETL